MKTPSSASAFAFAASARALYESETEGRLIDPETEARDRVVAGVGGSEMVLPFGCWGVVDGSDSSASSMIVSAVTSSKEIFLR